MQAAWPVAILAATRAPQLGHHARVVVLTSTDVAKSVHAERWAKLGPAQWSKVQAALDTGEHFRRPRDGAHFSRCTKVNGAQSEALGDHFAR